MRKLPLLLVVLALAALIAWFAWTALRDTRGEQAGPGDAQTAAPESSSASPSAVSEPAIAPAAPEDAGERAVAKSAPAARRELDPANAVTVRGHIDVPSGTPSDERYEVLALSRAVELDHLLPLGGMELDASPDFVLARAEAPAGAFELALPKDLAEVRLFALGRYAASLEPRTCSQAELAGPIALAVELGGWVTGRLVPPPGASEAELASLPATRVTLELDQMGEQNMMMPGGFDGPRRRTAEARADLTFEFRALRGGRRFDLFARPEGDPPRFAAGKATTLSASAGQHLATDIRLSRGANVSGIVVDESGAPIAGVDLEARIDPKWFGFGGNTVRIASSRDDGSFELLAVTPGKSKVDLEREGFLQETIELDLGEGEQRTGERMLLTRGASVAGRVLWPDRTPAAGVEVSLSFDLSQMSGMNAFNAARGAEGEARTDAAGAFAITGLGKGPFTVVAKSPPRLATGESAAAEAPAAEEPEEAQADEHLWWRARSESVRPNTADLELVLVEPQGLAGRVVDQESKPVKLCKVHARQKTNSVLAGMGGETRSADVDDSEGRFLIAGLVPGEWELSASADGFGQPELVVVAVPRKDSDGEFLITLPRAAEVRGLVLGPDGTPVRGASVSQHFGLKDLGAMMRRDRPQLSAKSDEEGRFVLSGVTAGSLELKASAPEHSGCEPLALQLAPGEVRTGLELRLRKGGLLTGMVYGEQGKPGAGINVLAQMPDLRYGQRFALTDSAGRFEMPHIEPGSWQVMTLPGQDQLETTGEGPEAETAAFLKHMKMTSAEIVEGEETHVVLGAPAPDPVRVHGTVRAGSTPAANVMLNFFPEDAKGLSGLNFISADATGHYDVELPAPGRHLISVQRIQAMGSQQSYEFAHKVPDEREYELDIELPIGSISGRVIDGEGEPVASARVSLSVEGAIQTGTITGGRYSEIQSDPDGRYLLEWIQAGTYTVAAGGAFMGGMFGGDDALGREIKNGVRMAEGEALENLDFRLKPSGKIAGVVRDPSGKPVAEAAIFVRDDKDRLLERWSMTQTDGEGRFQCLGLAEGSYKLNARREGVASGRDTEVAVRAGETAQAAIVLDAATVLVVSLVDEKDQEVDAAVLVLDEKGRQVNGMMSIAELMAIFNQGGFSSKVQRIGPLPPGKYKVTATSTDGRSSTKSVTLSGQAERDLVLRLKD